MFCPKCGKENPDVARFCGDCGAVFSQPFSPPPEPPPPSAVVQPPQAVAKELKIGIAIGSALIPILGIVMGIIYMSDANLEKKAAGRLWLYIGIGSAVAWTLCCALSNMRNL